MSERATLLLCSGALLLAGCAHYPTGPSVMALPGRGASFEAFRVDDGACREWAAESAGVPGDAAAESGLQAAAVGTAVGAAAGAAIGVAAGSPGAGAAIGAGSGLLLGSAAGADRAYAAGSSVQRRYDQAYVQCMYAKGHRVPLPLSARDADSSGPPRARRSRSSIPPPPVGLPPPPPPDA